MEAQLARIEAMLEDTRSDVARLLEVIDGNGDEGLRVRVDRLESLSRGVKWALGTAVTSGLATVLAWLSRLTS